MADCSFRHPDPRHCRAGSKGRAGGKRFDKRLQNRVYALAERIAMFHVGRLSRRIHSDRVLPATFFITFDMAKRYLRGL